MEVSGKKLIWLILVLFGSAFFQYRWKKTDISQHLLGHSIQIRKKFISNSLAEELFQSLKQFQKFYTNKNAVS